LQLEGKSLKERDGLVVFVANLRKFETFGLLGTGGYDTVGVEARNVFQERYRGSLRVMEIPGLAVGRTGSDSSFIPAWTGVRPPFLPLQLTHEHTTFSQVVFPPWDRGMTWSRLSWLMGLDWPQYWQRWESLAKRVLRLNRTVDFGTRS
jgi:hypothetical protein